MKIGSIVECINDSFSGHLQLIPNRPSKGKHYMVRDIYLTKKGTYGLRLEELINPPMLVENGFIEPTFKIDRFAEMVIPDDLMEEIMETISCVETIS